jgi:CheY-like chemotaxis protein
MEIVLVRGGWLVETAGSGNEALAAAVARLPAIILLDLMMPGMDGFEVATRLKADTRTRDIPIVMVTALDDSLTRRLSFEAGAIDFLGKPVFSAPLYACVRRHLLPIAAEALAVVVAGVVSPLAGGVPVGAPPSKPDARGFPR